jgi:predicted kinase
MFGRATVIVVSGLPCSGKSTLATSLSTRLGWPLLAKDRFKETLFDTLGVGDRAWSRTLSAAAYELLFQQAIELAHLQQSFIIEGNFRHGEHEVKIAGLVALGMALVQAHCHATPDLLIKRFNERMHRRHRGHADAENSAEIMRELATSVQRPLDIEGDVVDCASDESDTVWCEHAAERVLLALA